MRDIRRFARLSILLTRAVLATRSVARPGVRTGTGPRGPDPAKVQKLHDEARGSVSVSTEDATAHLDFVRAGQNGDLHPQASSGSPAAKVDDFVQEYKDVRGSEGVAARPDRVNQGRARRYACHLPAVLQGRAGVRRGDQGPPGRCGEPDRRQRRRGPGHRRQHLGEAQRSRRCGACDRRGRGRPADRRQHRCQARAQEGRPAGIDQAPRLPDGSRPGRCANEPARLRGRGHERLLRARHRLRAGALRGRSSTATRPGPMR